MVCGCMSEDDVVAAVELLADIRDIGLLEIVLGKWVEAAENDWFIHSEPVVNFGMVTFEDNPGVVGEIVDDVFAQPSTVCVL